MKQFLNLMAICLVLTAVCQWPAGAAKMPPGVKGDGVTDDTAAIQASLDKVGKTGGEVFLPPGQYLIKGSLTVPTGVVLRGSWEEPHYSEWNKGTTLLLTGGRGHEDSTPAITLQQSSAVNGLTMLWPDQQSNNIVAYPWAIHGSGEHNTVENVTFINAYQGIMIGQPWSELHLIRNVFGCVLRRGIFIDTTSDIGRIENVHFNGHYWYRSGYHPETADSNAVMKYMSDNLEAFIFGRSDWEYVLDTFVYGANIGYHFIKTPSGACNGQFTGIGADGGHVAVRIDSIQEVGIQVTNGEFTAFNGEPNAGVFVSPDASGPAQFVNCNFWATPGGAAQLHGKCQVTFDACHFVNVPQSGEIVADKGSLIVSSCTFGKGGTAIVLKSGLRSGIVMGNGQPGGLTIDNEIGDRAQIGLNETVGD